MKLFPLVIPANSNSDKITNLCSSNNFECDYLQSSNLIFLNLHQIANAPYNLNDYKDRFNLFIKFLTYGVTDTFNKGHNPHRWLSIIGDNYHNIEGVSLFGMLTNTNTPFLRVPSNTSEVSSNYSSSRGGAEPNENNNSTPQARPRHNATYTPQARPRHNATSSPEARPRHNTSAEITDLNMFQDPTIYSPEFRPTPTSNELPRLDSHHLEDSRFNLTPISQESSATPNQFNPVSPNLNADSFVSPISDITSNYNSPRSIDDEYTDESVTPVRQLHSQFNSLNESSNSWALDDYQHTMIGNLKNFLHDRKFLLDYIYQLATTNEEWAKTLTTQEADYLQDRNKDDDEDEDEDEDDEDDDFFLTWKSIIQPSDREDNQNIQLEDDEALGRPIFIIELLIYRYLLYLSETYYGNDAFKPVSNRVLNYFEYIGPELQNFNNPDKISDAVVNYKYDDLLYFRCQDLYVSEKIAIPIIYETHTSLYSYKMIWTPTVYEFDYLNDTMGLQYDFLEIPQYTKFKYVNYHQDKQLILAKGTLSDLIDSDSNILKMRLSTKDDIDKRDHYFYFYIPFKYVVSKWLKDGIIEYVPFVSEKYSDLEFLLNYQVWNTSHTDIFPNLENPTINSISRKQIMEVIKNSDLTPSIENYPLTNKYYHEQVMRKYPRNTRNYRPLFSNENKISTFNAHIVNNLKAPSSLLTAKVAKLMLFEFWNYTLGNSKNIISRIGTRQLLLDTTNKQVEWQKICSYLGKNKQYRLKRLQQIAVNNFNHDMEVISKLSKRELCKLLAKQSLGEQKRVVKKWQNLRTTRYAIPENICDNYSEAPDVITSIAGLEMKLFSPKMKELTSQELVILQKVAKDNLNLSISDLETRGLNNKNIKGWQEIILAYQMQIKDFKESESNKFIVLVKPDLTSYCISADTIKEALNNPFCQWELSDSAKDNEEDIDLDGKNLQPIWKNRNLDKNLLDNTSLFRLPFPDKQLKNITGAKLDIYFRKSDFLKLNSLVKNNKNNKNNKVLVFYLGEAEETGPIGNCDGGHGVSELHGQYHSNSALYPIVYVRRVSRDVFIEEETDEEVKNKVDEESKPKVNMKVKQQLDEIKLQEQDIILRLQQLVTQQVSIPNGNINLENVKIHYEQASANLETGEIMISEDDFIKDVYPNLIGIYEETIILQRQQRQLVRPKMQLMSQLYKPESI